MKKAVCIFVCVLAAITCRARTITVDDDAPADFNNIQAAIIDANDGDLVEIKPGRYTGLGNRDIDFLGKAITVRSTNPTNPEVVAQTIIDCNSSARAFFFQTSEDANSILDGLTIINGYSSTSGGAIYCTKSGPIIRNCTMTNNTSASGGVIGCESGSKTVVECCLLTDNSADIGGAVYFNESTGVVRDSVFFGNIATKLSGGAIRIRDSNVRITGSTFRGNSGRAGGAINCTNNSELNLKDSLFLSCSASIGGALNISVVQPVETVIANCVFVGNSTSPSENYPWSGGGALSVFSGLNLRHCLFAGNSAPEGGAILIASADMCVDNCTFAGNCAVQGDTLYTFGEGCSFPPYGCPPSNVHIIMSILGDGEGNVANTDESTIVFSFCDMVGIVGGQGNIDADPCFVDPGYWDPNGTVGDANDDFFVAGDYHLKSQGGRWDAISKSWVKDDSTSPCIDAGDPNSPLGQEPFPNGGRMNMGVYGGTAEASKSYFSKPPCETIVAGDINGDCIVNLADFCLMSAQWLRRQFAGEPYPYDGALIRPRGGSFPMSWSAGSEAVSHDIYLGLDYNVLRNAGRSSPEFKANQSATNFMATGLDPDTTYYWRIDEIAGDGAITGGYVWSFTTTTTLR